MKYYQAYLRHKLLQDIFDKMSEDEKRLLINNIANDKGNDKIMMKLDTIDSKITNGGKAFKKDFLANVLGNYFADATIFLGSKIIKAIK